MCGHRFTTYELEISAAKSFVAEIEQAKNMAAHLRDEVARLLLFLNQMQELAGTMEAIDRDRYGNAAPPQIRIVS